MNNDHRFRSNNSISDDRSIQSEISNRCMISNASDNKTSRTLRNSSRPILDFISCDRIDHANTRRKSTGSAADNRTFHTRKIKSAYDK